MRDRAALGAQLSRITDDRGFHGRFDPVAHWAAVAGTRTALIDHATDRVITYARLHDDAERWRIWLAARGVSPGDRVAVLARNRYDFVPLLFACIRLEAWLVPLNWRLSAPELVRVLAHADPALLIGEAEFAAAAAPYAAAPYAAAPYAAAPYAAAPHACRWHDVDAIRLDDAAAPADSAPAWPAAPAPAADDVPATRGEWPAPAMVLYTSGSTGEPKGVLVPQAQLYWNAVSTVSGWALQAHDVGQVITPLFHTAGWHVCLTPLLWVGGTVVLQRDFAPNACLDAMARHGTTITFAVPTQLDLLATAAAWGRPLPQLHTIISGGAPCPPHTLAAVRAAGYAVRDAYGLTECGPNCFRVTTAEAEARAGTVGWPLPHLETRIVNDGGDVLPSGETGELQLRGPQLCAGYFRDPARTAASRTADGWLRTGDVAMVDEAGAHYIRGRRSDMFISGGENVHPGEVEAALRQLAGVRDVVVVGVPDDSWGEVGHAVVVAGTEELDRDRLLREARALLAGYKLPRHLTVVSTVPRLGSGKVDRAAVRRLVDARAVEPQAPRPAAPHAVIPHAGARPVP